ncbi:MULTISPECIES: NADH:ubiquinone oxidoreductase subunit NDUFA12 [Limibacillus]|jgi:NADH:ubiquinone oxidoreductase subunit|uniref:NADH:ubiquinone oxidoreductase subunit n=1 Tax=Limibacillus halophilus TaxID=1579333 RepID=A0A839SRF5_9PROT|nr:NADH:ubiquinone oxidoreductase subunit NDUFA12 [Limibacillus halophilus]MBB3065072.1 NADH:ubiquinone oxidoreductase subunit [Limibacillus halophilus]
MFFDFGTWFFTRRKGEEVGRDEFGNIYYRERGAKKLDVGSLRRERRWVIYNGKAEASKVPPDWHAWLHHTIDQAPTHTAPSRKPWEKEHLPNLTGTDLAYRPPGHTLKGGQRAATGGDYEAWKPE